MAYRDKKPAELVEDYGFGYLGECYTRVPFWRIIDRLSSEKRELLRQLKSDDLKNRNWLFRK